MIAMPDVAKSIYGDTPNSLLGNARKVDPRDVLPPGHQLGMRVPLGGSSCASCEYLTSAVTCGNEGFQKWNGGNRLPYPSDEYCCDLYEIADEDADKDSD